MLGAPGASVPAPGEVWEGAAVDPREGEDWFQQLDREAQDLVRQRWLGQQLEWERMRIGRAREIARNLAWGGALFAGVHAGLIFFLGVLLKSISGGMTVGQVIAQLATASLLGMGLGVVWLLVDAGILLCALTSFGLIALFEGVLVNSGGIHVMALVCGPLMAGLCGRYVGLRRHELPGA